MGGYNVKKCNVKKHLFIHTHNTHKIQNVKT